jgi:deoxyribodipyrimidine photolyase
MRSVGEVVSKQGKFDLDGNFLKKDLPALRAVPLQYIHKLWEMPELRQLALSDYQEAKQRFQSK